MTSGVGATPMGGMLGSLEYEYAGTSPVVDEEADAAGRSESGMVVSVPPIGNDCAPVSVMKDTEFVGVAVTGAADEEPITYPAEVEVASEA